MKAGSATIIRVCEIASGDNINQGKTFLAWLRFPNILNENNRR